MTIEQAKEQSFTHHAEMYGVKGFYKEDGYTFEAKTKFGNLLLDLFIWVEQIFDFNDEGFPIKIKDKL